MLESPTRRLHSAHLGTEMTALPEMDVARATPEIASIYAEIARLSGIPLPALIWRHLATKPEALPIAWAALRPLYVGGLAQDAAWKAVETVLADKAAGPTAQQLESSGLAADVARSYRNVLRSYNRANPVNFVGVRILLAALGGARRATLPVPPASPWSAPAAIDDLPPMVAVADIPADVRRLIDSLSVAASIDRSLVVPSLYRHLVPWPALLRLIHDDLAPRIGSGEIGGLVDEVSGALQARADGLAMHVGPLPGLGSIPGVGEALESFSRLIPEMIVIGGILVRGLDDH